MPKITFDQFKKKSSAYQKFAWEIAVLAAPFFKTPLIDTVKKNDHLYLFAFKNPKGGKLLEECWDKAEKLLPDNGLPPPDKSAFHKAVAKSFADDNKNILGNFFDWFDKDFPKAFIRMTSSADAVTSQFVEDAMKGAGRSALKSLLHEAIASTVASASSMYDILEPFLVKAGAKNSLFLDAVLDFCDDAAGAAVGENVSGLAWFNKNQAKYPNSRDLGSLAGSFKSSVAKFIKAMKDAGANVEVKSTRRDATRAFIMHYAWKVAHGLITPDKVPVRPGLDINWDHGNDRASRKAAKAMIGPGGFGMADCAALASNHISGLAIDMTITWSGVLTIKNASGEDVVIDTSPRDGGGNAKLWAVGETYGVIKYQKLSDPPHWSVNGR
jgi:hypothetical protein